ncbi:MAG: type I secretion C-terminal target domain-containing protein, partial [Kiloniellales bacterium]|nr:type I secretion C-terminal target domain-containing protein [Kiloniellales bacterium]
AEGPVTFANGSFLGSGPLQASAAFDGKDLVLTFEAALRLQSIDIGGNELGITLPQHKDGSFTVAWGVTTTETNPMDPAKVAVASQTQSGSFALTVGAVADKPEVAVEHVCVDEDSNGNLVTLPINASLVDQDGSEQLTVTVEGLPAGFVLASGQAANSHWTQDSTTGKLTGVFQVGTFANPVLVLPANFNTGSQSIDLTVTAIATEQSATASVETATVVETLELKVDPVNDAPVAKDVNIVMFEDTEFDSPFVGRLPISDSDDQFQDLQASLLDSGTLPIGETGLSLLDQFFTLNPIGDIDVVDTRTGSGTYQVTDPDGASDTADITITLRNKLLLTPIEGSNDADVVDFLLDGDGENGERTSTLMGHDGDDFLFAFGRHDELHGGNGNDVIVGGTGDDRQFGGSGNDTFLWQQGDAGPGKTGPLTHVDLIFDFEMSALGDAFDDVIDIADLFEAPVTQGNEVADGFIVLEFDALTSTGGSDVDTKFKIDVNGGADALEQEIVLVDVDLRTLPGLPVGATDQDVIDAMTANGSLITA